MIAALMGIVTVERCGARLPWGGGDTIVNVTCAPKRRGMSSKPNVLSQAGIDLGKKSVQQPSP